MLTENAIELAPGPEDEMYKQRFYLYLNLTIASEEVCISCHRTDRSGKGAAPSYFIGMIKRLFPKLETKKAADVCGAAGYYESRPGRIAKLIDGLRKTGAGEAPDKEFKELFISINAKEGERELTQMLIKASQEGRPDTNISRETAKALYNADYSVTRLEKFSECPYAHFLSSGLRLKERDEFEFSAADVGTIMHNTLMRFSYLMQEGKRDWHTISDEQRISLVNDALDSFVEDGGKGAALTESFRSKALLERIRQMLELSSKVLVEQVRRGSFTPTYFEKPYKLGNLNGVIDRMDICESGDAKYIRVIDYKTGKAELDLGKMLHGLCLQLPTYMIAGKDIVSRNAIAEPAGIYYYMLDDPFIKVDSLSDEVDDEKIMAEMKLEGLSRSEPEVLELLDNTLVPGVRSGVINVKLNKTDGAPDKYSKAVPGEDFGLIERFIKKKIGETEADIENGSAGIEPLKYGENDACAYCRFKGVCGYDENIPGYGHRICKKEDAKDALLRMSEAITNTNGKKKGDE